MQSGLILDKVRISLQNRKLLSLSLAVAPGERACVMGPSGAGKSALLAHISGSLSPAFHAQGDIFLNGRKLNDLKPEARRVGMLFQDDLLFPHLTVAGNLAFGLKRGAPKSRIDEALGICELAGYGERDVTTLSGGQRARISLLRVLLSEPEVLVLDEPFGKLDVALRGRMRDFVYLEAHKRQIPVLLVTHDPEDAAAAGGPVIRIGEAEAARS